MCKFQPHYCANGRTQIRGSDFTESFLPVIRACFVISIMNLAASCNLIVWVIDVTNAFQNTILDPSGRFYVTITPYYL